MTLREAKDLALANADITSTALIETKLNRFFDEGQREIAKVRKIAKSYSLSQCNPINEIGSLTSPLRHLDADISYSCSMATAYTFEVQGNATITLEYLSEADVLVTLATITNTETSIMTRYSELISVPTTAKMVYIVFSGDNSFIYQNVALYNSVFALASDIPEYGEYSYYDLPTDFYLPSRVLSNGEVTNYTYITADNKIGIPYALDVNLSVEYYAYPAKISATALDSVVIDLDDDCLGALTYYVASKLAMTDDPEKYVALIQAYQDAMLNLQPNRIFSNRMVRNIFCG